MLVDFSLDLCLDCPSVFFRDPAPLDKQVGQWDLHRQRPPGTDVGKLSLIDEIVLQGDDSEQQVAVDVDLRHFALPAFAYDMSLR